MPTSPRSRRKPKIHGRFLDVGIAIRVRRLQGDGELRSIGGEEHSHDFTELILFEGGSGTHRVDAHDYPVIAGDVFVVQGVQTHALAKCRDLVWTEVHFNAGRIPLPADQLKGIPGYHALFVLEPGRRRRGWFRGRLQLRPTRLAEAMQIVAGMDREYQQRRPGYEALLLSQLVELMVFLSREYSRDARGAARSLLRVGEVIGLLESEYHRPWRIAELCSAAHMSKSSLMVAFREATGQTPIEYLIHVRLRHAMDLLRNTGRPVTQIAYHVGFSDSNYFTRKFRQVVGASPSVYRHLRMGLNAPAMSHAE